MRVTPGESLWSIASRFHVSVGAIAAANHIRNANYVPAGSLLRIPGRGALAAAAPWWAPRGLRSHAGRLSLLPQFRHWAAVYGIPASTLEAMTWWESGWQGGAVSSTGAIGIGQLEPATVAFVRQTLIGDSRLNPWVNSDNIRMSARFLRYLLDETGWNTTRALAAYYEGLGSVRSGYAAPGVGTYVHGILAFQAVFANAA